MQQCYPSMLTLRSSRLHRRFRFSAMKTTSCYTVKLNRFTTFYLNMKYYAITDVTSTYYQPFGKTRQIELNSRYAVQNRIVQFNYQYFFLFVFFLFLRLSYKCVQVLQVFTVLKTLVVSGTYQRLSYTSLDNFPLFILPTCSSLFVSLPLHTVELFPFLCPFCWILSHF